ncbi:MAG: hypothetical protein JST16_08035 [Bdellovibrionales bacterium]|nr:hypothetical protein [Bdellovibrionales bacterium]
MKIKSALFFFVSSVAQAAYSPPTLAPECAFRKFQSEVMPNEREQFWTRNRDEEHHDLAGERVYNGLLVSQAVDCYQTAEADLGSACHLASLPVLGGMVNPVVEDSEYFGWELPKTQGFAIYAAKIRFEKELARMLGRCFKRENLIGFDSATFGALYNLVSSLQEISADGGNHALLPYNTASTSCVNCGSRDQETTYRIFLNGVTLVRDPNGNISLAP